MEISHRNRIQAWGWAAAITAVIFVIVWVGLSRIPVPTRTTAAADSGRSTETGPGGAFGEMTRLVGDTSIAEDESLPAPVELPEGVNPAQTVVTQEPEAWISEFYLDRGPALSFAPRLNPDGTPRSHPSNLDRVKAPTYEDSDTGVSPENVDWPIMTPQYFSKTDLPEELRDLNFSVTVRLSIDARGRVLGVPQIVRSSGHTLVDQLTIQKIMNEASFTPGTRKDTGEPIMTQPDYTIYWWDPIPDRSR